MNMTEQLNKAEDRFFEGLEDLQTQFVEANTKVADRIHEIDLPTPDVERVVEPADAVARYFDFAGKLMDANRKFAEQMVAAWYPAKTTPKTVTVKKSPAKKSTAKKAAAK